MGKRRESTKQRENMCVCVRCLSSQKIYGLTRLITSDMLHSMQLGIIVFSNRRALPCVGITSTLEPTNDVVKCIGCNRN